MLDRVIVSTFLLRLGVHDVSCYVLIICTAADQDLSDIPHLPPIITIFLKAMDLLILKEESLIARQ